MELAPESFLHCCYLGTRGVHNPKVFALLPTRLPGESLSGASVHLPDSRYLWPGGRLKM